MSEVTAIVDAVKASLIGVASKRLETRSAHDQIVALMNEAGPSREVAEAFNTFSAAVEEERNSYFDTIEQMQRWIPDGED